VCLGVTLNRFVMTIQTLALPTLPFEPFMTYWPSWQEWLPSGRHRLRRDPVLGFVPVFEPVSTREGSLGIAVGRTRTSVRTLRPCASVSVRVRPYSSKRRKDVARNSRLSVEAGHLTFVGLFVMVFLTVAGAWSTALFAPGCTSAGSARMKSSGNTISTTYRMPSGGVARDQGSFP